MPFLMPDPGESPGDRDLRERQEDLLQRIAQGEREGVAREAVGVPARTYWYWRDQDQRFAAALVAARRRGQDARRSFLADTTDLAMGVAKRKMAIVEKVAKENPELLEAAAREDLSGEADRAVSTLLKAVQADKGVNGLDDKATVNTQVNVGVAFGAGKPEDRLLVRDVDAFLYEDLGLARGSVYRRVVWQLRHIDRPDVRRALLCEAKASGKGYLCSLVLARALQRLFAASPEDLSRVYHLGPRPRVGVINLSASGNNQAQLAIFTDLRRWLAGPWFAKLPRPTRDTADIIEWELPDRTIIAFCGNSSSSGAEGINFVAAVADEVCRLPDKESAKIESADALVAPVEATMVNRCGDVYKLVAASWPEGGADYLHRQIAIVRDAGGKEGSRAGVSEDLTLSLVGEPMAWEPADPAREAELKTAPFAEYPTEAFLTRDATLVVHGPVWAFRPDVSLAALRQMEQRDPTGFAAMCGARPKRSGANAYYKDPEVVARGANPAIPCPLDERGRLKPEWKADGSTLYWGHVDAALGKKGGDAAGLSVAHWANGRVVVDAMLELRADEGKELVLDDLVEWFVAFQRQGATFAKVTRDGWEGAGIGQRFESKGIPTELFSVVRDRRAYDTFRDMLMSGLVDYYPYEPFHQNARDLVLVGRKVDHTANGAKDVHDAVSAVTYHVVETMGEFAGIKPAAAEPEPPQA